MTERPRTTIVIPCYNEAERLREAEVRALAADPRVSVLLVDDGSTDGTQDLLRRLAAGSGDRVQWMAMAQNGGKAEAVRHGMLRALAGGAEVTGYLDADFATPASEMLRLLDALMRAGAQVAMGARIARLGADIQRSPGRHYLGRVFATAASMVLGLRVYDTQCGAKLFRAGEPLRQALSTPFSSRWIFDVELLGRLVNGAEGASLTAADFLEVPLATWHDVAGSKLRPGGMASAGVELLRLGRRALRDRRSAFRGPD
ncbi:MAG: glycosyltransferase [Deltaproteobacteria bacterium]|nr:glycosyltransferase [Deltaproteobacteria bacterium]MCB9786202.1 glycosyltransferase [Deltaproteobacteria bacterium]